MPTDEEDMAWMLVSLELCGEANEQEEKELLALIKANPPLGNRLTILKARWPDRRKQDLGSFDSFYCKLLERLEERDPAT